MFDNSLMQTDLNEISVFVEVVRAGSFRAAALKLKMPNSTVSYKVTSLEKRLGVTLLRRTTRKLNMTAAGESYYKKCLAALSEIEAAETSLSALESEPHGLLRLTAPVELGQSLLPQLIAEYIVHYPQVTVELFLTERRVDLLGENFDLAIRAGELKDSSLVAKKIGTSFFALYASPRYVKAHSSIRSPKDLSNHSCLMFAPIGTESWKLIGPRGSAVTVSVKKNIVTNDLAAVKNLATESAGIALLPAHLCQNEVDEQKLIRLLPDWRTQLSPIHFVYPQQKFVSLKLSRFMSFAFERLRKNFEHDEK